MINLMNVIIKKMNFQINMHKLLMNQVYIIIYILFIEKEIRKTE